MARRYAIILAGGRSARMGLDKATLLVDGRSLLARTVGACGEREQIIVVGPARADAAEVRFVREDPPFGGPVAGLAAGLSALPPVQEADEVLVLPCDLRRPASAVAALEAAPLTSDGRCLVDSAGRTQYLTARYRRSAVALELGRAETTGRSMRSLVEALDVQLVPSGDAAADIDSPEQAAAAGVEQAR